MKAIVIRAALSLMVSVKIIQTAAQGHSRVGPDILMRSKQSQHSDIAIMCICCFSSMFTTSLGYPGNGPRSIKFNSCENLIKRRLIFPGQMDPWLNVTIGPNVLFVTGDGSKILSD